MVAMIRFAVVAVLPPLLWTLYGYVNIATGTIPNDFLLASLLMLACVSVGVVLVWRWFRRVFWWIVVLYVPLMLLQLYQIGVALSSKQTGDAP